MWRSDKTHHWQGLLWLFGSAIRWSPPPHPPGCDEKGSVHPYLSQVKGLSLSGLKINDAKRSRLAVSHVVAHSPWIMDTSHYCQPFSKTYHSGLRSECVFFLPFRQPLVFHSCPYGIKINLQGLERCLTANMASVFICVRIMMLLHPDVSQTSETLLTGVKCIFISHRGPKMSKSKDVSAVHLNLTKQMLVFYPTLLCCNIKKILLLAYPEKLKCRFC